jgi:hypothetical protein
VSAERPAEATHAYSGDESRYAVALARSGRRGTRVVRILAVLDGPGTIPLGAVVTVPASRVSVL